MTRIEHSPGPRRTDRPNVNRSGTRVGVDAVAPVVGLAFVVILAFSVTPVSIRVTVPSGLGSLLVTVVGGSTTVAFGTAIATSVVGVAIVETTIRLLDGHHRSFEESVDPTDPDPSVLSLVAEPYSSVEGTHRRLRALERLFRERGDRRAVFLTVYARVTEEVATALERGTFDDPNWVADYLVTFANFYRRALFDFETGRLDALPTAWRLAFRAAERADKLVLPHAVLGINAHVTFDLAFALFAIGVDADRRTKYRDHQRINLVLWRLVDVTLARITDRYAPELTALDDAAGSLVALLWFGSLVLGREAAWWIALVLHDSQNQYPARAARRLVAAVSATVARLVLGLTVHPVAGHTARLFDRSIGVRRL